MAQTPAPQAIIVDGDGPWRDDRWNLAVSEFKSLLADAGYRVAAVGPSDLPSALATPAGIVAVPSLESLPLDTFKAIAAYIARGGGLMASGGEPFRAPLYLTADGQWTRQKSALQIVQPEKTVLDPSQATLATYADAQSVGIQSTVLGPDGQSNALDVQVQLTQTYLLAASLAQPVFDPGQTATVFWTRGTPGQNMVVDWVQNDQSVWVATIPLTDQWTKQVLLPGDFLLRTFQGPGFNPALASQLLFGVALGFGALPGPVEFAVSSIGTATAPALEPFSVPVVETLSPWYKQYVTQRAGQTVRVPIARGRGLTATADPDGRYRAIGDPQAPAATWYATNSGRVTIWLPWPQLADPARAQLVALLRATAGELYLLNAGPAQIVTLPGEDITLGGRVLNAAKSSVRAGLRWTVSSAPPGFQYDDTLALAGGETRTLAALDIGALPPGNYRVTAQLLIGGQEMDRIDSTLRVLDPATTRQPNQRISAMNGSFVTGGRRLFLQGVNYWPRYYTGLELGRAFQSWLSPQNYDPDLVEADLSLLASLNFNLVSIQYLTSDGAQSLVDFLERCRNHGIWANIFIQATTNGYSLNPNIGSMIRAALLPGNDRAFAYDLSWEPNLGNHDSRVSLDDTWRAWLVDQYGSLGSAETLWGFTAPRDTKGQLSNPLDDQLANDGPHRVMVAAYRRFADDFLSRSFGIVVREVRRTDPEALLSFRNPDGSLPNQPVLRFDPGTAAAHLDFISTEAYGVPVTWPEGRTAGLIAAYARYRSGGKPFYRPEYGYSSFKLNGGTAADRAVQTSLCDTIMRASAEDGSSAAAVWWMPGGLDTTFPSDYGIFDPDGSPRGCALVLAQWAATFAANPPDEGSGAPLTLTIDRDADARGETGLFERWQNDYVQAKQDGRPVVLVDDGTGSDTSSMPLAGIGNVPYAGSGPLKYANGEFAGIRVVCGSFDVTVENGAQVAVPGGGACRVTPSLVNTGSAAWLPVAQGKGGVALHTSVIDLPIKTPVPSLGRISTDSLQITVGQTQVNITGRLSIPGVGSFGENLNLSLVKQ